MNDDDIKERWSSYFYRLFNEARGSKIEVEQGVGHSLEGAFSYNEHISKE